MSNLNIKIENFEGPFDLLLHLIKKNEMNIYDIKIYDITNQYLQFLQTIKEMDLEITSEFIVMAATLVEIKSKMLLPKPQIEQEDEDPRKNLIEKLIEYKKYKKASYFFKERLEADGYIFTKKAEIIEDTMPIDNKDLLKNITMLDLYNIFNELMNRYVKKINKTNIIDKEIPIDKYKIEDKMKELKNILASKKSVKFSEIACECQCKMEIVVTFLALLEMIKEKTIKVTQPVNFDRIYIERVSVDDYDITM